jgi:hypothetical protein
MKISERTISAIGEVITGDKGISPYRSGPALVRLFNEFGANDSYGQGFPSRWDYAEKKLREINGTPNLPAILIKILDPREYLNTNHTLKGIADYLNPYLKYDGFELVFDGDFLKIRNMKGASVIFKPPFGESKEISHLFIDEQIKKCDKKIDEDDYDGAITNARSFLEAILCELEKELCNTPDTYDGDLPKLYKRVQKVLNLDPGRPDIEQPIKQVLSGLMNIVMGISAMRNKMSDSHVRSYRPSKRHAKLVVNAAKTIADFLFETKVFQKSKKRA